MIMTQILEVVEQIAERAKGGTQNVKDYICNLDTINQLASQRLSKAQWLQIKNALEKAGCKTADYRGFQEAVKEQNRNQSGAWLEGALGGEDEEVYFNKDGRMWVREPSFKERPIADWTGSISSSMTTEQGERVHVIEGKTVDGESFTLEIEAGDFEDPRKLSAFLGRSLPAGYGSSNHGMASRVPIALHKLSHTIQEQKLFKRTGWYKNRFLIRGREKPGETIRLDPHCDYNINPDSDLELGIKAFVNLIKSVELNQSLVCLAGMFAPTIRKFFTQSEKFCTFGIGNSGSLKTAFILTAIRIFAYEFDPDNSFMKWGIGSTVNGAMEVAATATDMMCLIDNFKPNTTKGVNLITLINALVEGGTKVRANRYGGGVASSKPLGTYPYFTGEDFPLDDQATVARCVPVIFDEDDDRANNMELIIAQNNAEHLCKIGEAWIDWIESKDGADKIKDIESTYFDRREYWFGVISSLLAPKSRLNKRRMATNTTTVELTIRCMMAHPVMGKAIEFVSDQDVLDAVFKVAETLCEGAAFADEGEKFLDYLKQLLQTGRVIVVEADQDMDMLDREERERAIGWEYRKDSNFVLVNIRLIRSKIGEVFRDYLGNISDKALKRKLIGSDAMIVSEKGDKRIQQRVDEGKVISGVLLRKDRIIIKEIVEL